VAVLTVLHVSGSVGQNQNRVVSVLTVESFKLHFCQIQIVFSVRFR
jgi:hypothetical protein